MPPRRLRLCHVFLSFLPYLLSTELRARIADRVRIERRRLKLSQANFARECQIPLRTYKRFGRGQCDSLEAFLRVVKTFELTAAIELLFPPKASTLPDAKSLI